MPLEKIQRWRPLDASGLEHFRIEQTPSGFTFRSALVTPQSGIFYEGRLDPDWTFRTLSIRHTDNATLDLASDGEGNWSANASPRADLKGCIDIDLSGSPFTNSLPIRRTTWRLDAPHHFEMAWIDLEALTVHRAAQIYTKLSENRFHYRSPDSGFEAEITVDDDGFVRWYPSLFEAL